MKIINKKRGEANRAEERKEFAGKAQMPEARERDKLWQK